MDPTATPEADTREHHLVPRISASKMERTIACAAAQARAWEAHLFRVKHGLSKPESGADAARGTQVHDLLSRVPFVSAALGLGDSSQQTLSVYRRVVRVAAENAFEFESSSERWFCVNAIRKRDRLIEAAVMQAGRLEGDMQIELDARRMKALFPMDDGAAVEVTGLADVFVKIPRADGGKTVVICDYKSLYGEHPSSVGNPQLATLAGLARIEDATVDRAYVSLIGAGQSNEELDLAEFDTPTLDLVVARLREVATQSEREARRVIAELSEGDGGLSGGTQEHIATLSAVGGHCLHCEGNVCCAKLRQQLGQFVQELKAAGEQLAPAREALQKNEPMTPSELTEAFRQTRDLTGNFKLYEKLEKDLTAAMRDLLTEMEKNGESIPSVRLKPGKNKTVVRAFVKPAEEEGALYPSEPEPFDAAPRNVFEKVKPAIVQASGGEVPDFEAFLTSCYELSPTRCSDFGAMFTRAVRPRSPSLISPRVIRKSPYSTVC